MKNSISLILLLTPLLCSSCEATFSLLNGTVRKRAAYNISLDDLKDKITEIKSRVHYKSINQPCPKDICTEDLTDEELKSEIEDQIRDTQYANFEYHRMLGRGCSPIDCGEPDLYSTKYTIK